VNLPFFQKRSICAGLTGQDLDEGIPPSAFSEMSPVCFRPVFDGIREVWFDGCAIKRDKRSAGSPPALVCVQTPAPFLLRAHWRFVTAVLGKENYGKNYGKENEF
jgi:hypothetical protein